MKAFDFDHRDPTTNVVDIAKVVKYSQERFDLLYPDEVKQCDLLCCITILKRTVYGEGG